MGNCFMSQSLYSILSYSSLPQQNLTSKEGQDSSVWLRVRGGKPVHDRYCHIILCHRQDSESTEQHRVCWSRVLHQRVRPRYHMTPSPPERLTHLPGKIVRTQRHISGPVLWRRMPRELETDQSKDHAQIAASELSCNTSRLYRQNAMLTTQDRRLTDQEDYQMLHNSPGNYTQQNTQLESPRVLRQRSHPLVLCQQMRERHPV